MSIAIVQHAFGGPDVLEAAVVPSPEAGDLCAGEVLVRVAFAGVNPVDVKTRRGGAVAALFPGFPVTLGWDLAGTVVAAAPDVRSFTVGDRVFGMSRFPRPGATYAQLVVADAADLVATPHELEDEQAAALPLAGLTVWESLVEIGDLQPGRRLLIQGAGGGTGHLAVQLAHHLGAVVTATASTGKQAWLSELGAETTIDYTREDVSTMFPERPFDLVFNTSDGTARSGIAVARPGGLVVDISETVTESDRALADESGVRVVIPSVSLNRSGLEALAALAAAGHLVSHISRVYPLVDAAEAHRHIEAGHTRGKVLLQP